MEMIQKTTSLFYVAKYGREACQRQALEIEKDFEKVTSEKFVAQESAGRLAGRRHFSMIKY